jgi:hypothetical protein
MNEEKIKQFFKKKIFTDCGREISSYLFTEKGIEVFCNVELMAKFTKLPFKFYRIHGDFCVREAKLRTLENCPEIVDGDFVCTENNIVSFEGAPISCKDFYAESNKITSLKYLPKNVRSIEVGDNKLIPSQMIDALFITMTGQLNCSTGGFDFLRYNDKNSKKFTTKVQAIHKIINLGRVNGKMPRELIPSKINELRDLDA